MVETFMRFRLTMLALGLLLSSCAPTATQQRPFDVFGKSYAPVVLSQECKGLRVKFAFERKSQTVATYSLHVTDEFGQPLSSITRIILAFTPLDQDDDNTVTLVAHPSLQDATLYAPKSTYAPNPGLWKVETVVRRDRANDTLCTFTSNL
jgi:hypothetical protein